MFRKILIANRGEIACRILRTAQAMGIKTCAVYSDADAEAPHVRLADEAHRIGPPRAQESYLAGDKLIKVAREAGADAIHPGYGFLSENAGFARAVSDAGICFIGPQPHAIDQMGDKITARGIAQKAGVNTIPGHDAAIDDEKEAERVARAIGYPVMVKAAAGGGGKGMRIVSRPKDLKEFFHAARREAEASFGDARVFIEKAIETPRHIEIQILCDKHGKGIHLWERECSVQRRAQKVIEEAPSPILDKKTRASMGAQALALAESVGYDSAGTVEFILDAKKNFYFLEMNTRLQVEHPVSEMIFGLDLVEEMIRIAAGEKLRFTQKDVKAKGWAVEARLYAEDPQRDFLPSGGRLTRYREPPVDDSRRIDSGVEEGSEVSLFYDPMLAKLVAHGKTRESAIAQMSDMLGKFDIEGPQHNLHFLSAIMAHKRFQKGALSTAFIAEAFPGGFDGEPQSKEVIDDILAAALFMDCRRRAQHTSRRVWKLVAEYGKHRREARCTLKGNTLELSPAKHAGKIKSDWQPGARILDIRIGKHARVMQVRHDATGMTLFHLGSICPVRVHSRHVAPLAAIRPPAIARDSDAMLLCPMPGEVVQIHVVPGQKVKAGEALISVEAMKMENILRAERDSVIDEILCAPGDTLVLAAPMIRFRQTETPEKKPKKKSEKKPRRARRQGRTSSR